MKEINIGTKVICDFSEPLIIADIGANFNGDIEIAKEMIIKAKDVGIDVVKFQSWTKESFMASELYNDKPTDIIEFGHENRGEFLDFISITKDQLWEMKKLCNECGVIFSSTPFSYQQVDDLVEMDVPFIKIASMDLNNLPYLKHIAEKGKPIILSTGMGTIEEIDKAVKVITAAGNEELVLLHCTALYPPLDDEVNLNNIDYLRERFNCPIGYSDHTIGCSIPLAASAKGACVIEKHYTLDKAMPGWDHAVSATPQEFKVIADESKRITKALGHKERIVGEREYEQRKNFRRSIVAKQDLLKGTLLTLDNVDFKRPGTGIHPDQLEFVLGRSIKNDVLADTLLSDKLFV